MKKHELTPQQVSLFFNSLLLQRVYVQPDADKALELAELLHTISGAPQPDDVTGFAEMAKRLRITIERKLPDSMAERAKLRPSNFATLSPAEQWQVDKELGILDWDGTD